MYTLFSVFYLPQITRFNPTLNRDSNPCHAHISPDKKPAGSGTIMAIGTRLFSARQLFGATLTLYLLGFLLMVSVWDNGVDNGKTSM